MRERSIDPRLFGRPPGATVARVAVVLLGLSACGPQAVATGEIRVSASGEAAAVGGYPTPGPDPIAFADGWSITFDDVLVSIEGMGIREGARTLVLEDEPAIVDLHDGDALVWTFPAIAAQRWSAVEYVIAPPAAGTRTIGSVDPADATDMTTRALAVLIHGTATHPTHPSVGLEIAVPGSIHAEACQSAEDMTLGLVVPPSGTSEVSMVFHLDHFFFDSAVGEEPSLRFEAWAAVAGVDGVVTLDDLATQDLTDLVGVDGMPLADEAGALVIYEPPSTGLRMANLREYVLAQAATLPHWNGEGHCDYRYDPPGG